MSECSYPYDGSKRESLSFFESPSTLVAVFEWCSIFDCSCFSILYIIMFVVDLVTRYAM